jgi:nucleotide-binding universal stress UspA family protein
MVNLRRILCPVDFSALSRRALDHAVHLAHLHMAEVTCLHVAPFATVGWLPYDAGLGLACPDPTPELEARLASFVQPALRQGVTGTTVVVQGDPTSSIVALAGALPADLLVMGIRRREGFEHLLLGSVAERILQRARCAVLTVPGEAGSTPASPPPAFRRILCAVDFSKASLAAARYGASVAALTPGSSLALIHVQALRGGSGPRDPVLAEVARSLGHPKRNRLRRLREAMPAGIPAWVHTEAAVVPGAPSLELLRVAREKHADLLVAGRTPRGPLHRLLSGSTLRRLVREAPCPVLAVVAPEQVAEGGHEEGRHAA